MAPKNLQEVIDAAASPVELLRNSQIGSYIYPVVPADFQNWIKEQKAWRDTAVLYDQSHHMDNLFLQGLRRDQADLRHRDQLDRDLPGRQGQAVRADHRIRSRHRRRHPVPRGGGRVRLRRPRARVELAAVPRRDRRLPEPRHRDRPPLALAPLRPRGDPPVLPLPDPGPERVAGHREAQRRTARAAEVLQHVDHDDRRHHRADAASRHGRRTRAGDLGPVRRPRPHLDRDRRGRRRVRPASRSARAPTPRTRSSRAGSPRRCPRSTPAPKSAATASGCPPTATRRPARSPARSSPTTSRTTTSPRGSSATATS